GTNVDQRACAAEVVEENQRVGDEVFRRAGDEAVPVPDQSGELGELRIVHQMPIYEYRCESCSGKFEVLTRFAERDKAQIYTACESTRTRELVSSFAVTGGEASSSL